MTADEAVPVVIWIAGENPLLDETLYATLTAGYPYRNQTLYQPLAEYLRGQGHKIKILPTLPAIAVTLTKQEILDIDNRPDVGKIFLTEAQEEPQGTLP
jgi:hypothetical protein